MASQGLPGLMPLNRGAWPGRAQEGPSCLLQVGALARRTCLLVALSQAPVTESLSYPGKVSTRSTRRAPVQGLQGQR